MEELTKENNKIALIVLNLLIDIILNNTSLDYEGKLMIDDGKPILEFIRGLDGERYEAVENVRRGKYEQGA